jgi:hypothetical protein
MPGPGSACVHPRRHCADARCIVRQDGDRYGYLFLTLIAKIKTEDNVQYMLTLVDDIITGALV